MKTKRASQNFALRIRGLRRKMVDFWPGEKMMSGNNREERFEMDHIRSCLLVFVTEPQSG